MQAVEIRLLQPNFFCPVTGRQILGEEACTPSPATVFVYIQDENLFDFVREDLKQVAEAVEASSVLDHDKHDGVVSGDDGELRLLLPFEALNTALPGSSVVDFVLCCTEMSCGPVTTTVHLGIDMKWAPGE